MTDSNVAPYEGCAAFALGWTLGWGTGALRALVVSKGWEWFVAGTFGATALSFFQVWGLLLLVGLVTSHFSPTDAKNDVGPLPAVVSGLLTSVTTSVIYFVSLLILSVFL